MRGKAWPARRIRRKISHSAYSGAHEFVEFGGVPTIILMRSTFLIGNDFKVGRL